MSQRTIFACAGAFFSAVLLCGICFYFVLHGRDSIARDEDTQELVFSDNAVGTTKIIEKVVSSAQLWRPVQERVRDTVVQIFAQVAESDQLQPYKTPAQGGTCGSGFFIDGDGHLLTNWHVIDQARAIWIQIPSLGKRIIDVEVVSVSPDRDIALLKVADEDLDFIRQELGSVPYLPLGNSDSLFRSDEVLALGYPLGQQSLKSTSGIISGREHHLVQTSAPINQGNSGGPLINSRGEVVGINEANVPSAQNVGYAIPINDVKIVLPDMYKMRLLRKPFLGVLFNNGSEALAEFLGNPIPCGCYVVEVVSGSTLDRAGVKSGDMIYEINGLKVDMFGEMGVPWMEDKISIIDYVGRLSVGQTIDIAFYRNGDRKQASIKFSHIELPAIRKTYPSYEDENDEVLDHEVFAGMVVRRLTANLINSLGPQAPGLARYTELKNQKEPVLVVTHIFPSSQLYRLRTLTVGSTLNEVNGVEVRTLADLREALKKGLSKKFLTVRASDNVTRASDNIFVALPWVKILDEEPRLARDYRYPMTVMARDLITIAKAQRAIEEGSNMPMRTA